ncbi:DUF7737 domain-containing protein [Actinomadura barringtoniae]
MSPSGTHWRRLSLILSKAFPLADDTAITDASILSQIKRGGR